MFPACQSLTTSTNRLYNLIENLFVLLKAKSQWVYQNAYSLCIPLKLQLKGSVECFPIVQP